jgi:dynein heavy chain
MITPVVKTYSIAKQDIEFIADSFDQYAKTTLTGNNFLKSLLEFSENDKNDINEETIELLEPYLKLMLPNGELAFSGKVAKGANNALEGMCVWAAAMSDYHTQSKIVTPKLKLLEIKTAMLEEAERQLAAKQAELDECNALKERLRKRYDDQKAE